MTGGGRIINGVVLLPDRYLARVSTNASKPNQGGHETERATGNAGGFVEVHEPAAEIVQHMFGVARKVHRGACGGRDRIAATAAEALNPSPATVSRWSGRRCRPSGLKLRRHGGSRGLAPSTFGTELWAGTGNQ